MFFPPSARSNARAAAKAAGAPHYFTGLPCPRGHVDGYFVSSNQCRTCSRERQAKAYKDNPGRGAIKASAWRQKNRDKYRIQEWTRSGRPQPTRPEPGICECCGSFDAGGKGTWHLDHCYQTGKFRGWLCNHCNLAIGLLGDDLKGAQCAVSYLRRAEEEHVPSKTENNPRPSCPVG